MDAGLQSSYVIVELTRLKKKSQGALFIVAIGVDVVSTIPAPCGRVLGNS